MVAGDFGMTMVGAVFVVIGAVVLLLGITSRRASSGGRNDVEPIVPGSGAPATGSAEARLGALEHRLQDAEERLRFVEEELRRMHFERKGQSVGGRR